MNAFRMRKTAGNYKLLVGNFKTTLLTTPNKLNLAMWLVYKNLEKNEARRQVADLIWGNIKTYIWGKNKWPAG